MNYKQKEHIRHNLMYIRDCKDKLMTDALMYYRYMFSAGNLTNDDYDIIQQIYQDNINRSVHLHDLYQRLDNYLGVSGLTVDENLLTK